MKKILIVWIIVAVLLVGALTFIGFKIKIQNKPYHELEAELERQAIALVGEMPSLANNSRLAVSDFEDNNYAINMMVNDDKCDGYVLVQKNMGLYKYDAFIKCHNYTTKGYK